MRKKIIFILFILSIFVFFCFRIILSQKVDKEIINRNINISTRLEKLELGSILLYKRVLYSKNNSFQGIDESTKLLLQYDTASYDIDLMPIIISKSVIICQTHSIKILNANSIYEYKCNEQIQSITYPKREKKSLIFYVIKFDSNKNIGSILQSN